MLGQYGIALIKNGVKLSTAGAKITRIEYGRKLDAISDAKIELSTAGKNCCGQLAAVDHWNTDLVITAVNSSTGEDEVLWRGPVIKPVYRKGSMTIIAKDVLAWLERRLIEQDFDFPAGTDTSDIFISLANYAYSKDPTDIPVFEIKRYNSGTLEARKVEAASQRMTWNVVSEMLDAGLDVTTFGKYIVVGLPNFSTFKLDDTKVLGEVEIEKDGDEFADRVVANASRDITGIFPPGPPAGANGYPLVEGTVVDSQLPDIASAEAAAKARYDFAAQGVRRVRASGGLQLLPNSKIDPRTLLAGQLINFAATETCYKASETLRVGGLTVVVEKGKETATIELQPMGAIAVET